MEQIAKEYKTHAFDIEVPGYDITHLLLPESPHLCCTCAAAI
jgi:hypothetical protein